MLFNVNIRVIKFDVAVIFVITYSSDISYSYNASELCNIY